MVTATAGGREADVVERQVIVEERTRVGGCERLESAPITCRHQQRRLLRRLAAAGALDPVAKGLFEHHVGIRAAEAEGADASQPRLGSRRPWQALGGHDEAC